MSIYDYHRRLLSSDVWKADEMSLAPKARRQLHNQVQNRFQRAPGVYVVGELAGHYYHEESPLDVIISAPKELVEEYRREADVVNGYALPGTGHPVYFFIVDASVKPALLADKFGPIYDVGSDQWIGKRVTGITEMTRPEALLQQIKWRLYKIKEFDEQPYPYEWRVLGEALQLISTDERSRLMDELRKVIARLEQNIGSVLKSYNDPAVWRNASTLKTLFEEDEHEDDIREFVEKNKIPSPVVLAIMNVFRYDDVLEQIAEVDEKLQRMEDLEAEKRGVMLRSITGSPHEAPVEIRYKGARYKKASSATVRSLRRR